MAKSPAVPTIEDVAKKAKVSTATVSRCLNEPDKVTENTRIRVLEAVENLGYTPNFAARTMAAKRSHTIGAIIPTMDNAIFATGLHAFQEALHRRGYTMLVASSAYQLDREYEQIKTLVARGADGIMLIGHERQKEVYNYLAGRKIPTLATWSFQEDTNIPSIGFDNRKPMAALTREVLRLGHVNIAMIAAVLSGNDRSQQRVQGVKDALFEQGMDPNSLIIVESLYGIDKGASAFRELMSRIPRPSAVLCGNDVLAVAAIREAQNMGLTVPKDVSITGFDDIELARIVDPQLTTVHVPHHAMGRKAATELIDMVEEKSKGVSFELETNLRIRKSLGPHNI